MSMNKSPLPTTDPDRAAAGFVDSVQALRYNTPPVSFSAFEKNGIVARLIRPGSRVLDVGCGMGGTLKSLRDTRQCEVVGLEPNHSRAAAVEEAGVTIIQTTLDQADPATLGMFDYVMFLDVLEHMANPHEVLVDAGRLLKPGGVVIVSVPNVAHWSVRLNLLFGNFDYAEAEIMDATHLRWFTRRTVTKMVEAAGYELKTYDVSAGTWLTVYARVWPWKWIPYGIRARMIRFCVKLAPTLFGAQHIVSTGQCPSQACAK
ncbi:MAG: class I SAM-dependent methyltransferase [Dechloromonas sp.]|nr:class I SAM-dependent methyltransferase [Dechloromonas sp.]